MALCRDISALSFSFGNANAAFVVVIISYRSETTSRMPIE